MKAPPKMMVSSSPGRENLQALPFMRLLKGKGGSRSRGRALSSSSFARSSPMFVGRRRSSVEIRENKEPGSPKVTCIGQVRIKKKKKKELYAAERSSSVRDKGEEKQQKKKDEHSHGCRCLQRALFCNPFTRLPKGEKKKQSRVQPSHSAHRHHNRRGGSLWRRWFSPGWSARREAQAGKEQKQLLRVESDFQPQGISLSRFSGYPDRSAWSREDEKDDEEEVEKAESEETKGFAPSTPPKNALLLMRCRSAPQHASSLTNRFSVPEDDVATTAGPKEGSPIDDILGRVKGGGEGVSAEKSGRNSDGQEDGSCDESTREEDADEEAAAATGVGPSASFSSQPLILTRCKSAPSRKTAKLATTAPEAPHSFWSSNTTSNGKFFSSNGQSKRCLALANESFPSLFTK